MIAPTAFGRRLGMRILGLVIMRAKRYDEHNAAVDREMEALQVKIGSLEFDKKELQKQLKDAEIRIENLEEMNAGLWEMKGVSEE